MMDKLTLIFAMHGLLKTIVLDNGSQAGIHTTPRQTSAEMLDNFLLKYQVTPCSTTGVSSAELLMGCQLRMTRSASS